MNRIYFPFVLGLLFVACRSRSQSQTAHVSEQGPSVRNITKILRIGDIPLPAGYKRIEGEDADFAAFLRDIRLKEDRTVYLFDGSKKQNQTAQFAVLNISVGNRDLQQCADAVMRLRAEYLFDRGLVKQIAFTDNNGKVYQFTKPFDHEHLLVFMNNVFGMCGSASLSKQLFSKNLKDAQPGDVLIRGGFPGHAVMIMDVAENKEGRRIFMIAQSYMPAQDIHLLINPMNTDLSPWYYADLKTNIETPEYIFTSNELKSWEIKPIRIDND